LREFVLLNSYWKELLKPLGKNRREPVEESKR
jgi:hypothetical protein